MFIVSQPYEEVCERVTRLWADNRSAFTCAKRTFAYCQTRVHFHSINNHKIALDNLHPFPFRTFNRTKIQTNTRKKKNGSIGFHIFTIIIISTAFVLKSDQQLTFDSVLSKEKNSPEMSFITNNIEG